MKRSRINSDLGLDFRRGSQVFLKSKLNLSTGLNPNQSGSSFFLFVTGPGQAGFL